MFAKLAESQQSNGTDRLELYRLLSDAGRVELLALCHEEELSVGELANLLQNSQPQISRKASALRKAGLLEERREGTRIYLKTGRDVERDVVVRDAIRHGRDRCEQAHVFSKLASVLMEREEAGMQFFESGTQEKQAPSAAHDHLQAHLVPFSALLPARSLAIDVGCGDGALFGFLSPLYDRVIAVDRSPAQLAKAASRIQTHGFSNVSLFEGTYEDTALRERVDPYGGADLVYCARALHHAPRPTQALKAMSRLLRDQGHLVVVDYLPHQDEGMRLQGDIWLGFSTDDLKERMAEAGLAIVEQAQIPLSFSRGHAAPACGWQFILGRKTSTHQPM